MNEAQKKAVISNSKWIDNVLWSGTIAAFVIILTRVFGGNTVSIPAAGFNINLDYAWLVISLITIAHLYTTILFVKSARSLWRISEYHEYKSVFSDIIAEGGIFFRDFKPRLLTPGSNLAPMSWNDLSTWTSLFATILLFFAVIPFSMEELWHKWWLPGIAAFLTYCNWTIGSKWAIALSELAVNKHESMFLAER